MRLPTKLTLLFLLLSLVPLALVGYLSYESSQQAIKQNTESRLTANNIFKENELNRWLGDTAIQLRQFASRPLVQGFAKILTNPAASETEIQAVRDNLLTVHLAPTVAEGVGFLDVFLLDSRTGEVLVSTRPGQRGKFWEQEPYFVEGQNGTFIDHVRYSLNRSQAEMHISTPVRDESGAVLAVLAARLDLSIMSEIMNEESGLNPSEETYLVNSFNFFVTTPKLSNQDVALKKAVYTDGVQSCLTGNSGIERYNDYRGVPVLGAYRWLPERELCILTEVDQAEAFAPVRRLGTIMLGVGGLIAGIVVLLAVVFARTITDPIQELVKGTEAIGRGNLDYRINLSRPDELGDLATAFNQMAARREQMEEELRRARDELEQRVQERTIALRRSEEKYRQLAETAEDIILTHDVHGAITYINRAGLELSRYREEEISRLSISDLVAPEELDQMQERRDKRLKGATSVFRFETKLVTKHGRHVPVEVISSLLTSNGRPAGILILGRDISERKQAEAKLKASEERFRALTQNSSDLIMILDEEGVLQFESASVEPLLGYPPDEPSGRSIFDLLHPDDRSTIEEAIAGIMETENGTVKATVRLRHKDGSWRYFEGPGQNLLHHPAIQGIVVNARDVTDRISAEQTLRQREERFRALIQNSSDVIVLVSADGKVVWESQAVTRVLGYDPDERVGRDAFESLHPDDLELAGRLLGQLLEEPDEIVTTQLRSRHKTGDWRWIEVAAANMLDEPAVEAIVANYRDITDRKEAELALQENEQKLRRAQRIAHLGSWEMELATGRSEWSDEFYRICGFEPGSVTPTAERCREIIHPDDRERAAATVEHMLEQGQEYAIEKRVVRPTGEIRHVLSQGELAYDKNRQPLKLVRTFLDITDRKVAELELQASEARFRAIVEAIPVPIVITRVADGEVLFANTSFCEFHELPPDEVLGRTVPRLYHNPADRQRFLERLKRDRSVRGMEISARKMNGDSSFWASVSAEFLIFDGEQALVAGFIDITQIKENEAELKRLTVELQRSNEELEQFAYVSSHDLQEPLRMVSSFLQLLERRYAADLTDEAREFIAYAVDGAGRMKVLINDLLAYSRVGTRGHAFVPVDSEVVLEQVLTQLSLAIEDNQATITHDPLPTVIADKIQLEQLLQNLISNGLKFRAEAPPKIHIGVEKTEDEWRFCVRDNGIGIKPEFAHKIFIIFQRLHGKEAYPGTGIGLAVCKKIVERHGGQIWVESQPGRGSSFYFTLPQSDHHPADQISPSHRTWKERIQ